MWGLRASSGERMGGNVEGGGGGGGGGAEAYFRRFASSSV